MPYSRVRIVPYRSGSQSARDLSGALRVPRLLAPDRSSYRPRQGDVLINWGCSSLAAYGWALEPDVVLNEPEYVGWASNKLTAFQVMERGGVSIPGFTEDADEARLWLQEGHTVLARTMLRANSGRGIVKLEGPGVDIPDAPLYTKYVRKQSEWRVHVFDGRVIHRQRKIARTGVEPTDWQIRNYDNGFIFQQQFSPDMWHDELGDESVAAVEALGLDFGAVDVVWNNLSSTAYVIEVNTAPGIEGTTLDKYVEAFKEALEACAMMRKELGE